MSFYVVSVQPRREAQFMKAADTAAAREVVGMSASSFYWPRRELTIRRRGRRIQTLAPVFPGYVFLRTPEVTDQMFRLLKSLPGFYRFLESNDRIRPLAGRDEEIVSHFIRFGDVIGKSAVTLDENQRIRVLEGPLVGLEGLIVKIDKRKQRAKVRLDLYKESFLVDFGLELLAPDAGGASTDRARGQRRTPDGGAP